MAGIGSRFVAAGYSAPKPLIDVLGKPMIEMVIDNLNLKCKHRFIFICQRAHFVDYQLEIVFNRALGDRWSVVLLDATTEGAACTILAADDEIEDDVPVLIANSDQLIDIDFNNFINFAIQMKVDGLIMTFPESDPKWSYAKLNSKDLVILSLR
jgi:NDP-sugar pyrophosphorylase family protein